LYSECLTKEALDGLENFKIGGQIIQTVKYADDFVLMAKEETVLQGMIDKLIQIGRSTASSKTIPPLKAIYSFLLQMTLSSPVPKVIQQLLTSSSSTSCHFYLPLYLSELLYDIYSSLLGQDTV
jgi:hypothetical protein